MHDIGSLRAFHDACDASGRKCRECPLIDCPNKREIAAYLVCNLDEEACDKCKKAWFCSLKKVKRGNTHPLNPCRNSKDHDCTTCPESNCPFKSENWWKTGFQEYMDERLEKFRKRIDSIEEKD
jgi:hypothetical protein